MGTWATRAFPFLLFQVFYLCSICHAFPVQDPGCMFESFIFLCFTITNFHTIIIYVSYLCYVCDFGPKSQNSTHFILQLTEKRIHICVFWALNLKRKNPHTFGAVLFRWCGSVLYESCDQFPFLRLLESTAFLNVYFCVVKNWYK